MHFPPSLCFGRPIGRLAYSATLIVLLAGSALIAGETASSNWPQFRGPQARGVAEGYATPVEWDVKSGKNIQWKVPVPGLGHSSPVVWGDRIFLTTAVSGKKDPELKVGLYGDIKPVDDTTSHRFEVLAYSRNEGKLLWSRTAHTGVPRIQRHTKATHANSTVATDGTRVVAFFGSEGLFAYDMGGKLLWKKDLGTLDSGFFKVPEAQWGFGSSPVLHDDKVLLQVDVQGDSFVAALDAATGKELWRTPRDEVPTWGSPTVHRGAGRTQVIVNGWKHIGGYDIDSGAELWKMKGLGDIPTPTPYVAHDLIFLTSAHGDAIPVYAVKTSATGDISLSDDETSNQHIAWSDPRGGSYMPTSVVYGDLLYILRDNGTFSCLRATTGELLYKERVDRSSGGHTASLVAADGKIYVTAEAGEVRVVQAGPKLEVLATNDMGETLMATPAISRGTVFFRTRGHLVAVGHEPVE
ncbi:MAG: PQQ-binding-like beta-propeller repeat protein [Acidobacteriota bacterium]|nr:PQQ-binding-like beta-propeller repeat protein [Acidobacteriota bacterium]